MNQIKPNVSIIIPTYNRNETIIRSINSVLCQSYGDFELIIVDDASTDSTETTIKKICDDRIRYIKLPVNGGSAYARNCGIIEAKGDYIAFQDSDDEWKPDKLKFQMEVMNTLDQSFGLVYTSFYYLSEQGYVEWPPKNIPDHTKNGKIYQYMLTYNPVGGPTMLIRKECFEKIGLFNTDLKSLEDYELALRISKYFNLAIVELPLVRAYQTPGSLSKNIMAYIKASCLIIKMYKEDIIKYDLLERKLKDLRTIACQVISDEQFEQMIALL